MDEFLGFFNTYLVNHSVGGDGEFPTVTIYQDGSGYVSSGGEELFMFDSPEELIKELQS